MTPAGAALAAAAAAGQVADGVTYAAMTASLGGGSEANPVVSALASAGSPVAVLAAKLALAVGLAWLVARLVAESRRDPSSRLLLRVAVLVAAAALAAGAFGAATNLLAMGLL